MKIGFHTDAFSLSTVQAPSQGKSGTVKLRFLIVYVHRHHQWQMVAWQSTRLP